MILIVNTAQNIFKSAVHAFVTPPSFMVRLDILLPMVGDVAASLEHGEEKSSVSALLASVWGRKHIQLGRAISTIRLEWRLKTIDDCDTIDVNKNTAEIGKF